MEHQHTSKAPNAEPQRRSSRLRRVSALTHPAQHTMLRLQSQLGNHAVTSLLRSHGLQAKLSISQPGDPYEQEADRVADQVMRMPETEVPANEETQVQTKSLYKGITPLLQRLPQEDEEAVDEEPMIQRLPEPELEEGDEEVVAAKREDDKEAETVQLNPCCNVRLRKRKSPYKRNHGPVR